MDEYVSINVSQIVALRAKLAEFTQANKRKAEEAVDDNNFIKGRVWQLNDFLRMHEEAKAKLIAEKAKPGEFANEGKPALVKGSTRPRKAVVKKKGK